MPKISKKAIPKDREAEGRPRSSQHYSQTSRRKQRSNEDDNVGTQSSDSQSQARTALSDDELNRKVSDFVRYMLFMDAKKTAVKRGDITKNVMKEHHRSFPAVFAGAQRKLKKTFGYDLVETEHNKQKLYILVNGIPSEQTKVIERDPDDLPKMGLLLVILAFIFMKDYVLSEELLWQILKRLGIIKGKNHSTFGDVEKLIAVEFVRQMYLDRKKVVTGDTAVFNYRWGPRAELEIPKRNVLKMVAKIYDTEAEAWTTKYNEVLEDEDSSDGRDSSESD